MGFENGFAQATRSMSGAGEESIYGLIPEPMHIPPKQPLYRSKFPGAVHVQCGAMEGVSEEATMHSMAGEGEGMRVPRSGGGELVRRVARARIQAFGHEQACGASRGKGTLHLRGAACTHRRRALT